MYFSGEMQNVFYCCVGNYIIDKCKKKVTLVMVQFSDNVCIVFAKTFITARLHAYSNRLRQVTQLDPVKEGGRQI